MRYIKLRPDLYCNVSIGEEGTFMCAQHTREDNKCLLNKCMNGWGGFIAQESHVSKYLQGTEGNNKPLQSEWTKVL